MLFNSLLGPIAQFPKHVGAGWKVKYLGAHGQTRASSKVKSSWLVIEKEYDVLCVYFDSKQGVLLRIVSEEQSTPALFAGKLFEFLDSRIPSNP